MRSALIYFFTETSTDMDTNDTYLSEELYTQFLEEMPLVCVKLVLETDDGLSLEKRTGEPTVWFWPGGRLYKGESLPDAAHRIAAEELGIEIELVEQLGVQSHFWEPNETDEGVSRHTVNIIYHAEPKTTEFEIEFDKQHSEYRYITESDAALHEYVRR